MAPYLLGLQFTFRKLASEFIARERYADFNVRHFHEKLREEHAIRLSYSWVKPALQGAGWWPRGGSVACTASGGSDGRWRG